MKRGGTDASKFQFANAGTPVLLVNIPCRYAHTPTTMIHYDDYVNAIKLMTEIVLRLDEKKVKEIRSF
jgi:endoglucanase